MDCRMKKKEYTCLGPASKDVNTGCYVNKRETRLLNIKAVFYCL